VTLRALLHFPGRSSPKPTALAVLCPSEPWSRAHTDYQPEIQALTAMGLAVLQVDGRGAMGFGTKQREAIRSSYEESQIEDTLSALDVSAKISADEPEARDCNGLRLGRLRGTAGRANAPWSAFVARSP